MMIVVLGPDGSGKTTLAKSLADQTDDLSYLYFGNNPESRKYTYFNSFLSKNKKGKLNTLLRYIFIFINDFHYYKISKKANYIADRCPIDKLLGSMVNKDKPRQLYFSASLSIMPKPDFVILLHGDSDILYNRKKEIPIETIEYYISFYRKYLSVNRIKHIEIDTTKNDIENTLEISNNIINDLI